MLNVLSSSWALLLGLCLLMIGNGLQGTLLGVRGNLEGFSTLELSFVMSGYFVGFLGGSRMAPEMIRRVGHVRVFAALASLISSVMILYPLLVHPLAWVLGRVIIGFCFSGVYVTAESWLNNAADNANRGKALSLYMIVIMLGVVISQALMVFADPGGFETFIVASVLVSVSVAPILLSISPTPAFDTTKPKSLWAIWRISPLGCVGMFLLGGVFAAQFGMSAVYGAAAGLSLAQLSTFVGTFYVGALFLQYPLGWLSDRMDRRLLITVVSTLGGLASLAGMLLGDSFALLLVAAFIIGGTTNPLYSLLIAHTNDYLPQEDMAGASGGLVFINGLGAIAGPLIAGWLMGEGTFGAPGFFVLLVVLLFALALYAAWRNTRRPSVSIEDAGNVTAMTAMASPLAVEYAQEAAYGAAQEEQSGR